MFKSAYRLTVLCFVTLALVAGSIIPASAQTAEPGKLQVTGSAVVLGNPDIAHITLGVETESTSAQEAAGENAEQMAAIIAALKELGLTDQALATSGYNIYSTSQVLNRGTAEERTVTLYRVQNRLTITTRDLDQVGEIVDRAVRAGANQVQGISFDVEDKQALQLEALKKAVQQARGKAQAMAEAAEVELGPLTLLTESYSSYAPMVTAMAYRLDAAASTPIAPGEVEISATVQLEFSF